MFTCMVSNYFNGQKFVVWEVLLGHSCANKPHLFDAELLVATLNALNLNFVKIISMHLFTGACC